MTELDAPSNNGFELEMEYLKALPGRLVEICIGGYFPMLEYRLSELDVG